VKRARALITTHWQCARCQAHQKVNTHAYVAPATEGRDAICEACFQDEQRPDRPAHTKPPEPEPAPGPQDDTPWWERPAPDDIEGWIAGILESEEEAGIFVGPRPGRTIP
jgi:hypothetical protein